MGRQNSACPVCGVVMCDYGIFEKGELVEVGEYCEIHGDVPRPTKLRLR